MRAHGRRTCSMARGRNSMRLMATNSKGSLCMVASLAWASTVSVMDGRMKDTSTTGIVMARGN